MNTWPLQAEQIPKGNKILVIIICAAIGFCLPYFTFKYTVIYQPQIPSGITIKMNDSPQGIYLNVTPVDSLLVYGSLNKDIGIITKTIDGDDIFYNRNPLLLFWVDLFTIMITVAAGAFPFAMWQMTRIRKEFSLTKRERIIATLTIVGLLFSLALLSNYQHGLYTPEEIMRDLHILFSPPEVPDRLVTIAMLLLIPELISIMFIGQATSRLLRNLDNQSHLELSIYRLDLLDRAIRTSITITSVVIVFSVLTTSTLRQAILDTVRIDGINVFPIEVVYIYGLMLSVFLGVLYIPTYLYMRHTGRILKLAVGNFEGTGELDEIKLKAWKKKSASLIRVPNLTVESVEMFLGVLAPFLGSLVPSLNLL